MSATRFSRRQSRRQKAGAWRTTAVAGIFLLAGTAAPGAAEDYEAPPILRASELAPANLLSGAVYTVEDRVPTDGYLTHFAIHSIFGNFTAVGPGALDVRVREIVAIGKLQDLEQSEEFQKGAKAAASKTLEGLQHVVDEPTETLKSIPEGVGRFFQRTYRSAKTGVQKLNDAREGRAPGAPPANGPGSRLPGGVSAPGSMPPNTYAAGAKAAGNATLNALGFDDTRRRLARQLGVDPYTTNPVLAKKLDDAAWAGFAGDLGTDLLTAMIPGGALVQTTTRLSNWVWDTPPGDLRLQIEKTLLGIGVSQGDVDLLLRHRWYPLSLQGAVVLALEELKGVKGRSEVMPLVLTVASEEQARYIVQTLRMTARYHHTVKPLKELIVLGTVAARDADGEIVVAAPVDYLSWNEGVDRFTASDALTSTQRSIHLAGRLTERAREELEARGWVVHADSPLFEPILPAAVR